MSEAPVNEHGVPEPAEPGHYWFMDRHGAWWITQRHRDWVELSPGAEHYHWSIIGSEEPLSWRELGARWITGPLAEPSGIPGEYGDASA